MKGFTPGAVMLPGAMVSSERVDKCSQASLSSRLTDPFEGARRLPVGKGTAFGVAGAEDTGMVRRKGEGEGETVSMDDRGLDVMGPTGLFGLEDLRNIDQVLPLWGDGGEGGGRRKKWRMADGGGTDSVLGRS